MSGRRKKLKISSAFERDTSNLPHDIIQDILSRLPVKSLLRFKSVSKPWYTLISSNSKFARMQLNQSKNKSDSDSRSLYVYRFRYSQFYFLKFTNFNLEFEKLDFPIRSFSHDPIVLCSCDGLILFKNYPADDKVCVIWNPSTRTYTKFSCPYELRYASTRYGLCYDASSDDYKFVLLISNSVFVVHSYKNKSWVKKDLPLECILPDGVSPFVNGGPGLCVSEALHWVTTKSHSTNVKEGGPIYECNFDNIYELCCFDPKDDNFKKISTPSCFDDNSVFHLTDLGGKLCLYIKTHDYKLLEIWMMKDYGDFNSWTKLLAIENMPTPQNSFHYVTPLCLTNKSDVVLYVHKSRIVVYNPGKNMFREIDISAGEEWLNKLVLSPLLCWNNSLVLPNRIIKK